MPNANACTANPTMPISAKSRQMTKNFPLTRRLGPGSRTQQG